MMSDPTNRILQYYSRPVFMELSSTDDLLSSTPDQQNQNFYEWSYEDVYF